MTIRKYININLILLNNIFIALSISLGIFVALDVLAFMDQIEASQIHEILHLLPHPYRPPDR